MRKIILPLFLCFIVVTAFSPKYVEPAPGCGCNYLGKAEHKRQEIKNRAPGDISKTIPLQISDILNMQITSEEKSEIKLNDSKLLLEENKIVSVTGYAWIIKLSSEDCDIHIELSETNDKNAERVIAEIPNTSDYCTLHSEVLNDLQNKFHLHKKKEYHFDKTDNGGEPIKLTVTGYLFWDSGHPTNKSHGSDKVGSVWEVHPVFHLKWK
jgi:hypothetical protein